jgi:peptidoglycan-associated lipoprotein
LFFYTLVKLIALFFSIGYIPYIYSMNMRWYPLFLLVCCTGVFFACNSGVKIKDGATAYQYKKYVLAAEMLQKDYEKAGTKKQRSDIALQIARSYDFQNRFTEAEQWYKTLTEIDLNPDAWWLYAQSLKRVEKYEEAIRAFQQYLRYNPTARTQTEAEMSICQEARDVKAQGKNTLITVKSLATLNSSGSDFHPTMHKGSLYFSSTRQAADAVSDDWMGGGYADIYVAVSSEPGVVDAPIAWNTQINSEWHEGTPSFSADGRTVYFTRCGSDSETNDYCKILSSRLEGSQWSAPEIVPLMPDTVNVGHPFLTATGLELYFSSDWNIGYGGRDLYVSVRSGNTWGTPINLGPRVNTPGNEVFPFLTPDGKLLFSSDGHPGYGGLDIYIAEKQANMYANPMRLKFPINSGGDDFGIALLYQHPDDSVLLSGYFSSNRPGSANDDIYYFEQRIPPPVILPPPVYILAGSVKEPVYEIPGNPNSKVTGNKHLPGAKVTLTYREQGAETPVSVALDADASGEFKTILEKPETKDYRIDATKESYLSANKLFNTRHLSPKDGDTVVIRHELTLSPIFKEVEIVLENIYYDLDKWDIREDAKPTLDILTNMLKENPGIQIELASHTDSRGSNSYNQTLSQRRAQSVVNYLISQGIDTRRLVAKGYGEERLVNQCKDGVTCTDEEHQQNRRTTFSILSDNFKP